MPRHGPPGDPHGTSDIASSEKPDVQASAKRAYVGPRGKSKKRTTLKLKPRRPLGPRGREGY